MRTAFGPQLIGQTEKGLNAILSKVLSGSGLEEPHWVVLRLAAQHDGDGPLAAAVADRTHFADPEALIADLVGDGLLAQDHLTPAGTELLARLGSQIQELTAPLWRDLPLEDVAATERVLNLVSTRARSLLNSL